MLEDTVNILTKLIQMMSSKQNQNGLIILVMIPNPSSTTNASVIISNTTYNKISINV